MTRDIEKNDVDIFELFRWSKSFEIADGVSGQTLTLYQRIVSDADLNKARVRALRKAAQLRRNLRTEGHEDHESFLLGIGGFDDKDELITALQILYYGEYQKEAVAEIDVPLPTEPASGADQDEQEAYQLKVDNYKVTYTKAVTKKIEKVRKREARVLAKRDLESLYKSYCDEVIARLCAEEMSTHYYEMCAFFGTYKDAKFKKRVFKSYDLFKTAATQVVQRLVEEYRSLEMGLDTLKK